MSTSCNEDLAVMRNPFSTATLTPKVPDGQCTMSTGCRTQSAQQIEMHNTGAYILLQPGVTCMATAAFQYNSLWKSATWDNRDKMAKLKITESVTANDATFVATRGPLQPTQWRLVSSGARITLINNRLDDDGWFEAIRVKRNISSASVRISNTPAYAPVAYDAGVNDSLCVQAEPGLFYPETLTNWPENPSYITGKLKDINKHLFYLQTQRNDRKFIEWEKSYTVATTTAAQTGGTPTAPPASQAALFEYKGVALASDISSDRLVDHHFDSSFDYIMIRINAICSTASPCTVHVHTISNFEYIWDSDSDMAKFMTNCHAKPDLVLKTDAAIKSDIKPTMLRLPLPIKVATTRKTTKKKRARRAY